MLNSVMIVTIAVVVLALVFDFINGFHDTANSIATSVATRVLTTRQAIIMAASLNFLGAFISEGVAKTIGAGIVDPKGIPQMVILAALVAAIIWNLITWYYGIPSSSSHALIGGLIGSAMTYAGTAKIVYWYSFFTKIVLWLFLSPVIGFIMGYLVMVAINWMLRKTKPAKVTKIFSKAQIASAALMAFNHGGNDAQKSMGIISMALLSGGLITTFHVPVWVKISCAIAMALGTSVGGWKIIKTVGVNMAKLTPVNGFAAETGAAAMIFTASMLHAPVSTTHIISGSIMGVGASKRLSSVRWSLAKNIVMTWFITIPSTIIVGALVTAIIKLF
ncbi:inorganic phosphate transporter, PiT family [Clostridium cavendishii DSM 21758]|uniref:Inorganic phosphate transporter, PiT family n=1 Tax=Clostridium cavendishii DSM 21758 TaxID=1121302 RepID=A0A1M6LG74_9CLOT|nr:inorganic phosphate transporter [Clostridium cavendishii]SHJ70214.1 inorganic phosphate transporter, PiT family [Clostridium cavendishii DSM 21758]